ncbi:proteasome assembly chaperone [Vairimorpha necatrix]|uniref:Proteasome assembly chaperone n=1 Tax=Vairimorpha necatrix TaxID=6039 RepID=A0AAX4JCY4_9MICR
MTYSNRTGYFDFKTSIKGVETDIKILETPTHIFIYVSQAEEQINLFDDELKNILKKRNIKRRKELEVFCNLKSEENLDDVGVYIHTLFVK